MEIKKLSNYELLKHFEDAVCDRHYNPTAEDYNKSEFSLDELRCEIFYRISKTV